jgi:hypothetical protein
MDQIIERTNEDTLDLLRSREVEQDVLDLLDDPAWPPGKRPPEKYETGLRGDRVLRANGPTHASPGQRPGKRVV